MSDFINRTTLQFVVSVNDPDYDDPPWLLVSPGSPNAIVIAATPAGYRKIAGDVVSEMTQPEKDTVDAATLAAAITEQTAELKASVVASSPLGVDVRALIQNSNRRLNFLTNRVVELQNMLVAMLTSSGGTADMRSAGLAQSGVTTQTADAIANMMNTQTRPLAEAITDYEVDVDDPGVSG